VPQYFVCCDPGGGESLRLSLDVPRKLWSSGNLAGNVHWKWSASCRRGWGVKMVEGGEVVDHFSACVLVESAKELEGAPASLAHRLYAG
jgi:hypothetical protein